MIEKHTVIDWPPQTMDLNIIEAVCENTANIQRGDLNVLQEAWNSTEE